MLLKYNIKKIFKKSSYSMELLKSVPKDPPKPNISSLNVQHVLLLINCITITETRFQEEVQISARENGAKRNF